MKTELLKLVKKEIEKLGSAEAVSRKVGISGTALSQWLNGKYGADEESLNHKIASALGYTVELWKIAETRDVKMLHFTLQNMKNRSLFVGISEKAGSGKTASIVAYAKDRKDVFLVKAREWSGRMFLDEVMRVLGLEIPKGYVTIDTKITLICGFFKERRDKRCQLIIDEADKLRPSALRTLIPMYNECEDILSVVICGTENLKKEIKRGVDYQRKGYDELDSRFGRHYLGMTGATRSDVKAICEANGLNTTEKIQAVWGECPKVRKNIDNKDIEVVVDMRLLKRLVQREFF